MKIKLTESKLKSIIYEELCKALSNKKLLESIYDSNDGFYSNSTLDNDDIDDEEEYDEDKERENEIKQKLVHIDNVLSNSAFGVDLKDWDENDEEYYPYKPYVGICVKGEHISSLGEVFALIGESEDDCHAVNWSEMTDSMKDDVEELVNIVYRNYERGE